MREKNDPMRATLQMSECSSDDGGGFAPFTDIVTVPASTRLLHHPFRVPPTYRACYRTGPALGGGFAGAVPTAPAG